MRLQQPLRDEVVFRLTGDVDEPCIPSCAVFQCLGMIETAVRFSQVVALSIVWYLVLATMRHTIRTASHADRIPVRAAFLLVRESVFFFFFSSSRRNLQMHISRAHVKHTSCLLRGGNTICEIKRNKRKGSHAS